MSYATTHAEYSPVRTINFRALKTLNGLSAITHQAAAGTVFSMSFGTDESAVASPAAAKAQFAKFDQTFQRGLANGDTFLSHLRSHHADARGARMNTYDRGDALCIGSRLRAIWQPRRTSSEVKVGRDVL
jgi:hypothetical protein